ncbi:MAG: hypothetical protein Q9180_004564 [Flavoplaca navasiana]
MMQVLISSLLALVLFLCGLAIYRLLLSPIAGFPGPKIAALTGWYEFYHDYWCLGTYVFQIEKMHQDYGPIVRINPYELSIHDPAFYSTVYVTGSQRRTENYSHFAKGIDFDGKGASREGSQAKQAGKLATVHIAAAKEAKTKSEVSGQTSTNHTSLFRHIFSSEIPPSELSVERLTKEAEVLLGAGTVSTGRTLDFISYYVLADHNIRRRLEEELIEVMANYPRVPPKLVELEKLDYLKALIKEGLRLAMAELYIVLAVLYRSGGAKLELFETQESDVTPAHDFLIPLPRLESKGVRVVVGGG